MTDNGTSLTRLAQLARGHNTLLASLFAIYQGAEGLTDDALARYLEIELVVLPRLALCRRPRPAPAFRHDVETLARFSGANPFRLMHVIRRGESLETLSPAAGAARLLAARDHEELDSPPPTAPETGDHE